MLHIDVMGMLDEEGCISDFIKGVPHNYIDKLITTAVNFNGWGGNFQKEDVLQNIRLALLKNFKEGKYRGEGLITYVSRIAKIQCIVEIRQQYQKQKYQEQLSELALEQPDPNPGQLLEMMEQEKKEIGSKILMALDKPCFKMLILRYLNGFSFQEIGQQLAVTEVNARVILLRCLKKARELYEKMEKTV